MSDKEVSKRVITFLQQFGKKGNKSYAGGLWWKFCWEVFGLSFCFIKVEEDGFISAVFESQGSEAVLPFNPAESKGRTVYLVHAMPDDKIQQHFALLVPRIPLDPPPIKMTLAEKDINGLYHGGGTAPEEGGSS